MTGDQAVPLPDGHRVYGKAGVWIVAEPDGPVVAAFYAVDGEPGWWRGHAFGRTRRIYLPGDVGPVDVAGRFLAR